MPDNPTLRIVVGVFGGISAAARPSDDLPTLTHSAVVMTSVRKPDDDAYCSCHGMCQIIRR